MSCSICQTAVRRRELRGEGLLLCAGWMESPLSHKLCVVQQKAVVLRTFNNSRRRRRLSYRALPPPRALPLWKPTTTASSPPPPRRRDQGHKKRDDGREREREGRRARRRSAFLALFWNIHLPPSLSRLLFSGRLDRIGFGNQADFV